MRFLFDFHLHNERIARFSWIREKIELIWVLKDVEYECSKTMSLTHHPFLYVCILKTVMCVLSLKHYFRISGIDLVNQSFIIKVLFLTIPAN